jgi:predicted nucleic acid-binding protein
MVIVDTTIWIDYLRNARTPETHWLEREFDHQRLGLTDIILCEVLQGVLDEKQFVAVRNQLVKFEVFNTGGVDLAIRAASNYRRLRTLGYSVRSTVDCLIATFCLNHDHSLLHNDRDYDSFERALGLRVVHP